MTTVPIIPNGGFLAVRSQGDSADLRARLAADRSARSVVFARAGVTLAAWSQFAGQGVWQGEGGGVAFDLDLTNLPELCRLAGLPVAEVDPGELLFALYRAFGINFCDKLRGAFAFALWDDTARKLNVVTDPYGIRPVAHTGDSGHFAAASRIRHLEIAGFDKTINPEAIYQYLFFQAICSPVSIYQGVRKLQPGGCLQVSSDAVRESSWYDLSYPVREGVFEADWCREIAAQVEDAVARFVPQPDGGITGCFLSGGTDSSSIAGFYSRLSDRPAQTFSIGFDDPKYNELDFARTAANHFATRQHEYLVTPQDVLQLIHDLPRIYDEPLGNASVIAAYYCARLARSAGIDTLLGGDGGDEIFGGNERYVTNLVFARYHQVPQVLRRTLFEPLLRLMPDAGVLHKAKRYVRRANIPNPRRFYSYNLLAEMDNSAIFQADFLARVDTDCFFKRADELYQRAAPAHDTNRLLYLDMKYTITDNDLRKVTQMVEAAGLQVRYPLLDRDLVDFCGSIPPQLKVKPGKNRYIFKQAMRGILPDAILSKSKHGMGLPIAKWLRDDPDLNALLNEMLFVGTPELTRYVKPEYLHQLKTKLQTEETSFYGDNLWVYLVLEMWLRARR